jgi:integrase
MRRGRTASDYDFLFSLDSQVGARICNGLGIMRACLESQKLEQLEERGLRKATAAALAEAGASTHEIAAVTGHTSLEEIERYTRAARKKKLADAAMAKLK